VHGQPLAHPQDMEVNASRIDEAALKPLIVGVLEDLFFGVQISDAARRAGARAEFTKTPGAFWKWAEQRPALIVLDLTCGAMEPLALLRQLQGDARFASIPTIGYLPHVQEELRREAVAAGCGRILPRSAFGAQIERLIREAVAESSP